ncbi:hypothetical protein DAEQUDRAFT_129027 [Daedalea quercina L-15889]|uniref:Uncharacterized protein n=1 Tax=Daedalea quercina L-15889 TaxID=1314783 RepID=A0A165S0Y2_9APHY|nr:hypothetical protein DAEQUDRAFT_129027 [Daedalea quercina L-15889]
MVTLTRSLKHGWAILNPVSREGRGACSPSRTRPSSMVGTLATRPMKSKDTVIDSPIAGFGRQRICILIHIEHPIPFVSIGTPGHLNTQTDVLCRKTHVHNLFLSAARLRRPTNTRAEILATNSIWRISHPCNPRAKIDEGWHRLCWDDGVVTTYSPRLMYQRMMTYSVGSRAPLGRAGTVPRRANDPYLASASISN